jgi:hypothetical protein
MPDFYLDPKNGDDGHAGTTTGTARQTLSGIFGIGTFPANPITSTVTIKVVGTAEAPGLCETAAAEFDLSDSAFSGGGAQGEMIKPVYARIKKPAVPGNPLPLEDGIAWHDWLDYGVFDEGFGDTSCLPTERPSEWPRR